MAWRGVFANPTRHDLRSVEVNTSDGERWQGRRGSPGAEAGCLARPRVGVAMCGGGGVDGGSTNWGRISSVCHDFFFLSSSSGLRLPRGSGPRALYGTVGHAVGILS